MQAAHAHVVHVANVRVRALPLLCACIQPPPRVGIVGVHVPRAQGSYEANPPFVPEVLLAAVERASTLLGAAEAQGRRLSFAFIVPARATHAVPTELPAHPVHRAPSASRAQSSQRIQCPQSSQRIPCAAIPVHPVHPLHHGHRGSPRVCAVLQVPRWEELPFHQRLLSSRWLRGGPPLLLEATGHAFVDGAAHAKPRASQRYRPSSFGTTVAILQTSAAAAAWPVGDSLRERLTAACRAALPSEAELEARRLAAERTPRAGADAAGDAVVQLLARRSRAAGKGEPEAPRKRPKT